MKTWIETEKQLPVLDTNVEYSNDGINCEGTMDYLSQRTCMLAGSGSGNGHFGVGFATDDSSECERGLILDAPSFWRSY